MKPLNLPTFAYKIQVSKQGHLIFDAIRKKYVQLTPEEWVRQHVVHYLTGHLSYPRSLVRLEPGVRYNGLQHRADILVYDRAAKPLLLVECKAPHVRLNYDTWGQIARYNAHFNAQLLVITNGLQHFCWQLDYERGNHTLLPTIPSFDALVTTSLGSN
ncbi:MAG: type I restriction enzyme HsdR N-terminal domain-containing protein [Bacteroidota bacterium]